MRVMVSCPACLHEFDLEQARNDSDWRELVQMIMAMPEPIHRPLWQYLGLYQGKQQIRSIKMVRIVKELQPMIKAARVTRNRSEYVVTAQQFAQAMQYLVDARPESLVLPLKSNGYLLGMLANQAEQTLAKAEQKREEQLRNRPRENTTPTPAPLPQAISKTEKQQRQTPAEFKALGKILRAPRASARVAAEREHPTNDGNED